jgi:hypothetical protein
MKAHCLLVVGLLFTGGAYGAEPAADADSLAKALSNPVAALISVPVQLNYDAGYELGGERFTLNIQPVIPISISKDWNMISRTILPVIEQSDVVNDDSQSGLHIADCHGRFARH